MAEPEVTPHAATLRSSLLYFAAAVPTTTVALAWLANNWQALYWGGWIFAFLLVEIPAVFNARLGDTFSETWWRWLRIKSGEYLYDSKGNRTQQARFPLWIAIPIRISIVAFGVWLIGHLGFGLWGGE